MGGQRSQTQTVIVLTGPTASGKSQTALCLAQALAGEIVSADSMQLYRGLDIGTAKPTREEQALVPHHLIDILEPQDTFSVAAFQEAASRAIQSIHQRGRRAIVCGGTGQYLSALIEGLAFAPAPADPQVRSRLESRIDSQGLDRVFEQLRALDPQAAERIAPSDRKRIIRALEVRELTGQTISEQNRQSRRQGPSFSFLSFCLTHDRPILYQRINARVLAMVEQGLLEEARWLMDLGLPPDSTSLQAIGYKELFPALRGQQPLADALQAVQQATRRYAKRQLTWFRRMPALTWLINQTPQQACQSLVHKVSIMDCKQ